MKHKFKIELVGSPLANKSEIDLLLSYGLITSYKQRKFYDEYYFEGAKTAEFSLYNLMEISKIFDVALSDYNSLEIGLY